MLGMAEQPTQRLEFFANSVRCFQKSGWWELLPAAGLLVLGLVGILAATLAPTGRGGRYAVVAPPGFTLAQKVTLVQRAQGLIADMRADQHIVIAHSDDPQFVSKLYDAGAWLVIDPLRVHGCGANGHDRSAA